MQKSKFGMRKLASGIAFCILCVFWLSGQNIFFSFAQEQKQTQEKPLTQEQEDQKAQVQQQGQQKPETIQLPGQKQQSGQEKLGLSEEQPESGQEEGQEAQEPLILNADNIQYLTESKDFVATGNVVVVSKPTRLSCDKLTLNSSSKECVAEGNARLEDKQGIIESARLSYNFQTKKGIIFDSLFRSSPFFGRAEKQEKVSEEEFISQRGYMTTCDFDDPHFRLKTKKVDFFPGDKIQMRDAIFYVGKTPLLYLPQYNRSLRDPMMHVQMMAGSSKDWGQYGLTAWRYNLTEDLKGRIYLDYRSLRGVAEGFAVNYDSKEVGKGDFKFYYTQERDKSKDIDVDRTDLAKCFQRYFIRLRHIWEIDDKSNAILQYYKMVDSKRAIMGPTFNLLKDFFPREYQKDNLPLSYISLHRSFNYSNFDLVLQKRINRWYSQEELLPQIKYSMPNIELGSSPFYLQHDSSYVNYNFKNAVPSPSWDDITYNQFSMTNKLSLPAKMYFINATPFISEAQTYTDNAKSVIHRELDITYAYGSDLNTKFYRIFPIKTNFLGLDINGLRHIITPSASYSYSNTSSMHADKASFGGGSSVGSSSVALVLENKLQTKRAAGKVDLARLQVESSYLIKPKTGTKRGSHLSDVLFKLDITPYSWLSFYGDATYNHSLPRDNRRSYGQFTQINYDINFKLTEERKIGLGQRYTRDGTNEFTYQTTWRLNPKWKLGFYQRYVAGSRVVDRLKGLREQEYVVTRDLHCWEMDLAYNVKRGQGESVWMIFRLKAFPELEFDYNQSYNAPKPGSQGYHD